jgi:hypothetical protein
MAGKPKYIFTPEMDAHLTEIFPTKLSKDIETLTGWHQYMISYAAKRLGLKKDPEFTRTAGRLAGCGWSAEQVQYLRDNYRQMGDSDMAEKLQQELPREKPFRAHNIKKKRLHLDLQRTPEEALAIASAHGKVGGRAYTIVKNSGGANLTDGFVASTLTRDPDLREAYKQYPDLLNLKRQQILLHRQIKEISK